MRTSYCTCIISTYNEGERLLVVLNEITKVKNLKEIIVVDDGSEENLKFETLNPKLKYLKFKKNLGKAGAIWEGLKHTSSDYILTVDADLQHLNPKEIENAIEKITNSPAIDMIILKRINGTLESQWIRADTIFSGERILRKSDLLEIFKTKPKGFQIEIAINKYMMDNHKKVFWMPSSGMNVIKRDKIGWLKGTIDEQKMHLSMMKYAGFLNYLKQTIFFCRKRAE